jgi:hypothetical protein
MFRRSRVRPVPDENFLPFTRQISRHLAHPGGILTEATSGNDRPRLTLADDFVRDVQPLDVLDRHLIPFPV